MGEPAPSPPAPSSARNSAAADGTASPSGRRARTTAGQTATGQTAAGTTATGQAAIGKAAAGTTATGKTAAGTTATGQTATGQTANRRAAGRRPAGGKTARGASARRGATRGAWSIVLFLVVPAVIVPGALDRFVFGKLLVAAIAAGLAFTVAATGRLPRPARLLLAAGGVLLVLAAATSHSPFTAFFGRAPLSEGVFVLATYALAGTAGARLLGPGRSDRTVRTALDAMAWCAVAVAALAVLESFGLRPLSSDLSRPGSLLGNASDQGAFAVLYAGPLAVAALRRRRPLHAVAAVAALLTVVLSGSRGALVGVVVMLAIIAAVSAPRLRRLALGGIAAVAVVTLAVPFTRERVFGGTPLSSHTVSGRGLLWRETLHLFSRHPLLGVGPSQFETAIVGEHSLRWQRTVGPANPPAAPHDWLLQALVVGGPLFLLVAVLLVALVVRAGVRGLHTADGGWALGVLAGLTGYGVALLFHFPTPGTAVPAALLAGGLLAEPAGATSAARTAWREKWARGGVVALAGALAVVFAAASLAEVWLRLGQDAVGRGRLAAADQDYRTARTLRPWDADLDAQAFHQFVASATAGNTAALRWAKSWATELGPVADDEQVVQNRAALLQAQGDAAAAGRLLDRELHRDPHNPMLLLLRGVVFAEQSRYPEAERDLLAATRIDPANPKPWQDLALVYRAQGKPRLAAAATAKAQRLH